MINRLLHYVGAHALGTAALVCSVLALAGSSYAAFTINGSEIQNHTISPVKLNPKFVNGSVRAWAIVAPNGRVIAGAGGPKVTPGIADPGAYGIKWRVRVGRCATEITVDEYVSAPTERLGNPPNPFAAGYAVGATSAAHNATGVQTFNQQGQPTPLGFDVAVIC